MKEHLVVSVKTIELIVDALVQTKEGLAAISLGQDLANLNRDGPARTEGDIFKEHQLEKLEKERVADGEGLDD